MNNLRTLSKLATSLTMVALIVVAARANYNIYTYQESGGIGGGPWFQYVGTATSYQGGNVGLGAGGVMILDNRDWTGIPTTISYSPPGGGLCDPSPCKDLE
jgi:hypothetical protein